MKKIIVVIALFIAFTPFSFSSSDLEENTITMEKETWESYSGFIDKAIANPRELILVRETSQMLSLNSFFEKTMKNEKTFIVFDDLMLTIQVEKETEEREVFSLLILLPILSLIFMVLADRRFAKRRKNKTRIYFSAIAMLLALLFVFIPTNNFAINIATIFSAGSAMIVLTSFGRIEINRYRAARDAKEERWYKQLSLALTTVFYVATTLSLMLLATA